MGVNYNQYCLVGIELDEASCHKVVEPAKYENQNRYDPKTGKVTHKEKIVVKQEESVYEFNGKEYDDYFYDFIVSVASEYELNYAVDENGGLGVIGFFLGDNTDYGRVNLLTGSESINEVESFIDELKETFPTRHNEIAIHFVTSVG